MQSEVQPGSEATTRRAPTGVRYFRVNPAALSWGEFRSGGSLGVACLSVFLVKVCRLNAPGSPDDVAVDTLEPFQSDLAEWLPEDAEAVQQMCTDLERLGFHSPVGFLVDDSTHRARHWMVVLAHRSRPVAARVHRHLWSMPRIPKCTTFVEFLTALDDGTFVRSLSSRPDLLSPPECKLVRLVGASPESLLKAHGDELAKESVRKKPLASFQSQQALEHFEALQDKIVEYQVGRGAFVPVVDHDPRRFDGVSNPDVLVEIEKLEQRSTSWRAAFVILILSLAVFLGVGLPGNRSFLRLLAFVPILFFHEAGHYVAMRYFGYRNLKMFFIPGFGAAVTGRHYNVAGWKKVVVSLMGPLPGIALGILIGLGGMYWQSSWAVQASMLMLVLNAFNLLPILPLDGGHVVRAVLFVRHYWLDVGFRVLAVAMCIWLGITLKSPFLSGIGAAILIGLPTVVRLARTTRALQAAGFICETPDDQRIPISAADRIVNHLRATSKKPLHPRLLARQAMTVFEDLNSRPPGWLASLSLLAVHGASLLAACAFAVVLVWHQTRPSLDNRADFATKPSHVVSSSEVKRAGAPPALASESAATLVATFSNADAAKSAFYADAPSVRPGESLVLAGDSVFYGMPDKSGRLSELRKRSAQRGAKLGGGDRLLPVWMSIAAQGPDVAQTKAVADELEAYFGVRCIKPLVAPWSKAVITPDQRRSRATYARLLSIDIYDDPELNALAKKLEEMDDQPASPEQAALQARYDQRERKMRFDLARSLEAESPDQIDHRLVETFLRLLETTPPARFHEAFEEEASSALGCASDAGDSTAAKFGVALQSERSLELATVAFEFPAEGLTAITAWLESKGFRPIQYGVTSFGVDPLDISPGTKSEPPSP